MLGAARGLLACGARTGDAAAVLPSPLTERQIAGASAREAGTKPSAGCRLGPATGGSVVATAASGPGAAPETDPKSAPRSAASAAGAGTGAGSGADTGAAAGTVSRVTTPESAASGAWPLGAAALCAGRSPRSWPKSVAGPGEGARLLPPSTLPEVLVWPPRTGTAACVLAVGAGARARLGGGTGADAGTLKLLPPRTLPKVLLGRPGAGTAA